MRAFDSSVKGETFVFKNPSFYVSDLIKAMNNDKGYEVVGIREGEKLHECMITAADSRTTYEYNDYYIIYPQYDWYNYEKDIIPGGKKVQANFEYTSDNNDQWLSVDDLKSRLMTI